MASFKAKYPVLQELFAKKTQGGPFAPPSGARVYCLLFIGLKTATGRSPLTAAVKTHTRTKRTHTHTHSYIDT